MSAHTIKGLRAQFKEQGKFHTPPELAAFMKSLIPGPDNVREVYDPTCGAGSLLSVFPWSTPKYGQDIDESAIYDAMQVLKTFSLGHGDVLTNPCFTEKKFHAIVANPPFSVKWEPVRHEFFEDAPTIPPPSKADFAFIAHIIHALAEDGTAAVLCFPGICYRGAREAKLREWITGKRWLKAVYAVPGGQFEDTSIGTVALVLTRRPNETVLMVDVEKGLQDEITFEQIAENDFSWSVNQYVQEPEEEKPPVDPKALQDEAVTSMLKNIRSSLAFQKHVCQLEGWDFEPIRNQAKEVVETA